MVLIRDKFQTLSAPKSVFRTSFNFSRRINLIDAVNNLGNVANYKIIFLQKRTMLSLARATCTRIGVNGLHDISGVHSRGMSSWSVLKFPKGHPKHDPKGHFTVVNNDDLKNNVPIPDWKFTHAKPAIGHPKDPDVIETHNISETDLKGSQKPQSIARRKTNPFTKEDLSTAEKHPEFDAKLADGKPMAKALDELREKHREKE